VENAGRKTNQKSCAKIAQTSEEQWFKNELKNQWKIKREGIVPKM
jgi:hypothetical protein